MFIWMRRRVCGVIDCLVNLNNFSTHDVRTGTWVYVCVSICNCLLAINHSFVRSFFRRFVVVAILRSSYVSLGTKCHFNTAGLGGGFFASAINALPWIKCETCSLIHHCCCLLMRRQRDNEPTHTHARQWHRFRATVPFLLIRSVPASASLQ